MLRRVLASVLMLTVAIGGCAHIGSERQIADDRPPVDAERGGKVKGTTTGAVVPVGFKDWRPHVNGPGPYLLDTGDKLRIFVYDQPNLSRLYPVDQAGKVVIPLIGAVRARGRTVYQLAAAIRRQLGAKYVRDPQVTVDVVENRPFFILGEVRNAGQYPYVSGMTVETAVAIAGGFSERADEHVAKVTRRSQGFTETTKASMDYVLQPGDTVYVRERFF